MATKLTISDLRLSQLKGCLSRGECKRAIDESPEYIDADVIANNEWIQTLWVFWSEFRDRPVGLESLALHVHVNRPSTVAEQHLVELLSILKMVANTSLDDLENEVEKAERIGAIVKDSAIGATQRAIVHLWAAATLLGYEPDHFIRKTKPDQVVRIEGETEDQYEVRRLAVLNQRLIEQLQPKFSKAKIGGKRKGKKMTRDTYIIRSVWPRMGISTEDAKAIHTSPFAKITELLALYDPDGGPESAVVRQTIESIQ